MVLPMDRDTTLFINGLDQSMSEEECKLEVLLMSFSFGFVISVLLYSY